MKLQEPGAATVSTDVAMAESLLDLRAARVLDLGCGAAAFSRAIAAAHPAARVVALDVDRRAHAANLASARPANLVFGLGGAESLPFDDGDFDAVTMIKSLHHVPGDAMDRAFAEIRRVLAPSGHLFIVEPVFAGDFNEVMRVFHDEEQVRLAAFEATKRAVDSARFELVAERFFLSAMAYRDFAEFEARHIGVTHTEHHLSPEQHAEVRRRFERHRGPEGVRFHQPLRADLLRRGKNPL